MQNKTLSTVKAKTATPINFISNIITISTALFAITKHFAPQAFLEFDLFNNTQALKLDLRLPLWMILEGCVATVFSNIMTWLFLKQGGLSRIFLFITGLVAAWISLFLITVLILPALPATLHTMQLFLTAALASLILDLYLLTHQWKKTCEQMVIRGEILYDIYLKRQRGKLLFARATAFLIVVFVFNSPVR